MFQCLFQAEKLFHATFSTALMVCFALWFPISCDNLMKGVTLIRMSHANVFWEEEEGAATLRLLLINIHHPFGVSSFRVRFAVLSIPKPNVTDDAFIFCHHKCENDMEHVVLFKNFQWTYVLNNC